MLKSGLLQNSIKDDLSNKNSFDNWVRPIFYGKSSKNENWAGGAFQKQICFCSTTADSRQLIFKLTNGNSYDIIINSDSSWPHYMIPFPDAIMLHVGGSALSFTFSASTSFSYFWYWYAQPQALKWHYSK